MEVGGRPDALAAAVQSAEVDKMGTVMLTMPVSVAATSTAAAQEQQQQQQMQQQHHSKEQQMYSYDEYEEPVSTVNCSSLRSPRTCSTLINSTLAYSTLESAIPPDQ